MEITIELLIKALPHILAFMFLLLALFLAGRKKVNKGSSILVKRKSLIEQQLVLEALSAFAQENKISDATHSLGVHLAEMTGFEEWIIWLLDEKDHYQIANVNLLTKGLNIKNLEGSDEKRFFQWISQNAEAIKSIKHTVNLANSKFLKTALSHLKNGIIVPFIDGGKILGFIVIGGKRTIKENRSEQFLNLFAAIAGIIIKKTRIYEREQSIRRLQERDRNLAAMGRIAANLAHEIRNPLTFIKSAYQIVSVNDENDDDIEDLNQRVNEEFNRVNKRIEQLLSLARISSVRFITVKLNEVIENAVQLAELKTNECGIDLNLKLDDRDPVIKGDIDKLLQLFQNLLINSIQAISDSGTITIKGYSDSKYTSVEIQDTGAGIDAELADMIFDPFISGKKEGTGLGLSIAFSIAKAHNGSLELLDTSSQGTCFKVSLPLAYR